jgi:hypothetical protein
MNRNFLNNNSTSFHSVLEASKIIYELNPTNNRDEAIQLMLSFDQTKHYINLKVICYI